MKCPNCGNEMDVIIESNHDTSRVDWCNKCGTISKEEGYFGASIPAMGIILRDGYGKPVQEPEKKRDV